MSKVLILTNSSSGLYDFRNELIESFLREGYEVVISLPDEKKTKELSEEGCRVIHTDINRRGNNPIQDMGLLRTYKKLIRDEMPDLVLTYTIKPTIYGGWACQSLKVPYFATVTGLGSTFERGGLLLKLIVFMYRSALKKCRCIFFQNDENRKAFESYGIKGLKHITVSGSGVNLSKHTFEPYPGHRDEVTRFLYIGRVMKEKGTDEYLYAAKKLHDMYGDKVSFAAIGYFDDDYEQQVKAAEKEGYFKMIPYANEIHPYLKEADAIVHPSYHEGMSNVLMEAAATGRPVITTDISGCREVVDRDRSGFLVKPRDKEDLARALIKFMELGTKERQDMGLAGRKWVEEHFDRTKVVAVYNRELLGKTSV